MASPVGCFGYPLLRSIVVFFLYLYYFPLTKVYTPKFVCVSWRSPPAKWFALFLELHITCARMRTKTRSEPRGRCLHTLRAVEECAGTRPSAPPSLQAVASTLFCSPPPTLSYIAKILCDENPGGPPCLFCRSGQMREEKTAVGREK